MSVCQSISLSVRLLLKLEIEHMLLYPLETFIFNIPSNLNILAPSIFFSKINLDHNVLLKKPTSYYKVKDK